MKLQRLCLLNEFEMLTKHTHNLAFNKYTIKRTKSINDWIRIKYNLFQNTFRNTFFYMKFTTCNYSRKKQNTAQLCNDV